MYPTQLQINRLAQLFGCTRVVWNDALALCKASGGYIKPSALQKICITQAKRREERQWLSEVSNIPLQQSIKDLGVAFKNFFESQSGARKGQKVRYPRFKNRCVSCQTVHDRDENASVNIEKIGVGHTHDEKQTLSLYKTPVGATGMMRLSVRR